MSDLIMKPTAIPIPAVNPIADAPLKPTDPQSAFRNRFRELYGPEMAERLDRDPALAAKLLKKGN